jgi:hypothetical protein
VHAILPIASSQVRVLDEWSVSSQSSGTEERHDGEEQSMDELRRIQ